MNEIIAEDKKYKLLGEVNIVHGTKLNFIAEETNGDIFDLEDHKSKDKVISFLPMFNTKICDMQTLKLSEMSKEFPSVDFITITNDDLNVVKEWKKNHAEEAKILSDKKYKNFANTTNLYIPHFDTLARGFILLDKNNKILATYLNQDIEVMPDFKSLEEDIKRLEK